jgi:hypothetical protein
VGLGLACWVMTACAPQEADVDFQQQQLVLRPGSVLTAVDRQGRRIRVRSTGKLTRCVEWPEHRRPVRMIPRREPWLSGQLGGYDPQARFFPGPHAPPRVIYSEYQLHYAHRSELIEDGLNRRVQTLRGGRRRWVPLRELLVYDGTGLAITWAWQPDRNAMSVVVFQMLIQGRKPEDLPHAQDGRITLSRPEQ